MNIEFDMAHFGPQLIRFTNLPAELINEFRKINDTLYIDYRELLAGQISDEKGYNEEQKQYSDKLLKPYLDAYMEHLLIKRLWKTREELDQMNECVELHVTNIWANRMRAFEYNPLHNHNGNISFVLYTDVPEQIHEEKTTTTSNPPGSIQFVYNADSKLPSALQDNKFKVLEKAAALLEPTEVLTHPPSTGEMFMFPSYLRHFVMHFTSDVVRESVAGNASFFITKEFNDAYDRGEV